MVYIISIVTIIIIFLILYIAIICNYKKELENMSQKEKDQLWDWFKED